ncbi:MAG: nitronate monooxygenase, partial [Armatimonadota bacterium]
IQDGAEGVQIGTAFALSRESGLTPELRQQSLEKMRDGSLETFTDPKASPSGFPFKVALLEESLSEQDTYADRPRTCDLGYLRKMYRKPDGTVGYRCASEPLRQYEAKGGKTEDTEGRKCLCNALVANIGLAQVQKTGYVEQALVTLGDDFTLVKTLTEKHGLDYSATDVVSLLLDSLRG